MIDLCQAHAAARRTGEAVETPKVVKSKSDLRRRQRQQNQPQQRQPQQRQPTQQQQPQSRRRPLEQPPGSWIGAAAKIQKRMPSPPLVAHDHDKGLPLDQSLYEDTESVETDPRLQHPEWREQWRCAMRKHSRDYDNQRRHCTTFPLGVFETVCVGESKKPHMRFYFKKGLVAPTDTAPSQPTNPVIISDGSTTRSTNPSRLITSRHSEGHTPPRATAEPSKDKPSQLGVKPAPAHGRAVQSKWKVSSNSPAQMRALGWGVKPPTLADATSGTQAHQQQEAPVQQQQPRQATAESSNERRRRRRRRSRPSQLEVEPAPPQGPSTQVHKASPKAKPKRTAESEPTTDTPHTWDPVRHLEAKHVFNPACWSIPKDNLRAANGRKSIYPQVVHLLSGDKKLKTPPAGTIAPMSYKATNFWDPKDIATYETNTCM